MEFLRLDRRRITARRPNTQPRPSSPRRAGFLFAGGPHGRGNDPSRTGGGGRPTGSGEGGGGGDEPIPLVNQSERGAEKKFSEKYVSGNFSLIFLCRIFAPETDNQTPDPHPKRPDGDAAPRRTDGEPPDSQPAENHALISITTPPTAPRPPPPHAPRTATEPRQEATDGSGGEEGESYPKRKTFGADGERKLSETKPRNPQTDAPNVY